MSTPASSWPRQPQPTIRTRAKLLLVPVAVVLGASPHLALGGIHLGAHLLLRELGPARPAAALVLRLQHLLDVLHVEADLVLIRAGGRPVEHVGAASRVPL